MPKKVVKKSPHRNNLFFLIVVLSSLIIIGVSVWIMSVYASNIQFKSKWCGVSHSTTVQPPTAIKTSADYFDKGNFQYDTGDCLGAVANYTQALKLNSKYPEAFNNRGYTYMMLGDYKDALPDLDNAIKLRPAYVNALMNRGDIYNYYFNQDKNMAIADYDRVIALGQEALKGQSTCGHRLMAVYNHNLIVVFWHLLTKTNAPGC